MTFERLEDRTLLTAVPWGATSSDNGEFMLGDVLVTTVLMESSVNSPNTENWTQPAIDAVKQKVIEGTTWWKDTLSSVYPDSPHSLNFEYDFSYADNPVATSYEPISGPSDDFQYWIYDFLNPAGYGATGSYSSDIDAFNHAQREAYGTDWAYTIFVVNDENDPDGEFSSEGTFARAFAFPGGQFFVTPAGRPSSTFAHETGHIFWARDEYKHGGSYTDRRGYYDAANSNAWDNPVFQQPGQSQADSIMAKDTPPDDMLLSDAYAAHTSSVSSLEMIGWRDSDGDNIFDVLDVPLTLTGSGFVDPQAAEYRFVGWSSVETLMNQNSSGNQNDITINEISRAEYRMDGAGDWQTAAAYPDNMYMGNLDLHIPLPDLDPHTIEVRTVSDVSGVTSPIFVGDTTTATRFLEQGINGFVWNDMNDDGGIDPGEPGLSGWTVRLVDAQGVPSAVDAVEPDDYASFTALDNVNPKVALSAVGIGVDGSVYARATSPSSTGANAFNYFDTSSGWGAAWTPETRKLRMDFTTPVTAVRLDAVGNSTNDYARLEAYDIGGTLLTRYTTGRLDRGNVETMTISRSRPDIAYVIAHGHMGADVSFDNLRFGPETETLTDAAGAFSLTSLPPDTYFVEAIAPGSQDPLVQDYEITLAEGEEVGDVNFDGQSASWRNPKNPSDVNDDGIVSPLDVLAVITYINAHPNDASVPPPPAEPPPFYDVDGNGFVTALDALIIIDVLNEQAAGKPDSQPIAGEGGSGEGELAPTNLASAADRSHEPAVEPDVGREPVIAMPLPAPAVAKGPDFHAEPSPAATPSHSTTPVDRPGLWQAAADSYFRQISSAEDRRSSIARQSVESDSELDEILPGIAVEVTRLSEAFAALRA